ncbi:MAG: hypothetical protein JXR77_14565 [Lentisphaeria bacterium]|nr:hypothetical protein [Lentisphaeria bacterium]
MASSARILCGMLLGLVFGSVVPAAALAAELPALDWEPRSDWVNVQAHGARGDGTADDTAAIQAALDRVVDGSGVYLPRGTYRITAALSLKGPLVGVLVVGHGRDTILAWDGPAGGRVFTDNGVAYSRFVGLLFDGRGKAAIGFHHWSDARFETEVRHQHCGFRDFTDAGVRVARDDRFALAETSFENCLFERCGRGVAFTSFNDYDYTFDGCEFRSCDIGVECVHGNAYVRNCRFEGSRIEDIHLAPEHGCSVRRCVSVGSSRFLQFANSVSPVTLQNCLVAGWTGAGEAVRVTGAPVLVFDCTFRGGPLGMPAIASGRAAQRLLLSCNRSEGPLLGSVARQSAVYHIPPGPIEGQVLSAETRFLQDSVATPGKVVDARRDFGAEGDGVADDTAALQCCIEAAREHGGDALAYLPSGRYLVSRTLTLSGHNYRFGGSGFLTRLVWRGEPGGTLLAVRDPDRVTVEHINIGSHDAGKMDNAVDVLQTGSGVPSSVTYDGVFVYGMYQKKPFTKGMRFEQLGPAAVVRMPHVQGNLHIRDCGRATILAGMSFEGSVTVEGREALRDGLLGFLTRLSTLTAHGLYVRDNQSVVMSDFYVEQADDGFVFEGTPDLPPGRVTIQGAKVHFTVPKDAPQRGTALSVDNYRGTLLLGHNQYYVEPVDVRIRQRGEASVDVVLFGTCFYRTRLDPELGPAARLVLLGNEGVGEVDGDRVGKPEVPAADRLTQDALALVAEALDDLRRLGEADLRLNHPLALRPPADAE